MAKNRKKVRRKSKAAEVTAQKRAERGALPTQRASDPDAGEVPEKVEFEGGGGVMTRMRGGFQSAVGAPGTSRKKSNWLNNLIWLLLIIGALFFVFGGPNPF